MKKILSAMLVLTLLAGMACTGLAEKNKAQLNAELYRQEKFYEKDHRSYAEDAFDLSGLPDYEAEEDIGGWIEIWGHSALASGNLADLWADGFQAIYPDAHITWNLPGKEVMLTPLYYDKADMVIVEEPGFYDIMPYERMLSSQPLELNPFKGSADMNGYQAAFAVIVNKDMPLDFVTMDQLDGIFGCARNGGWVGTAFDIKLARGEEENIRTWGEMGLTGEFADAKIEAHAYPTSYSMGETLSDKIISGSDYWVEGMNVHGSYYDESGNAVYTEQDIVNAVAADRFAIGIVSGQYFVNDDVKVIAVAGDDGVPVACTPENIHNGTYPLARDGQMFIRVVGKLSELDAAFLRYIFSEEGQKAVAADGKFVPLNAEECAEQLAKVEAASTIEVSAEAVSDEAKEAALRTQQAHFETVRSRAERKEYTMDDFDLSGLPHYVPETYPEGFIRIYGNDYIQTGILRDLWNDGFKAFHPTVNIAWEMPSASMGYGGLYLDVFDLYLSQRRTPQDAIAYHKIVGEDLWGVMAYSGSYKLGGWGNTLVVEVNEENPIESITVEQLDGIFGGARSGGWDDVGYWHPEYGRDESKNIRTWGELGLTGEWENRVITPYTFQLRYNTAREVSESLLQGSAQWNENIKSTGNYRPLEGPRVTGAQWVVEHIVEDKGAIGLSRYTDDYMLPGIKFVPVIVEEGGEPVYPDKYTTQSREYPFVFSQNFWYKVEEGVPMNEICYEFLKYVLSYEGQTAVMQDAKYQPLTAEVCQEMLEKLEAVRYGY